MSEKRPERIWLLHNAGDQGEDLWCDQPTPNDPPPENTEYVRADKAAAAPALVEALEKCRHAFATISASNGATREAEQAMEDALRAANGEETT
jgi:DNA-binding LacI/PurR family transcriptional regulator